MSWTRPIRSQASTSDAFPPMTGIPVVLTTPLASWPADGSAGKTNDQAIKQIIRSRAIGQRFRPL
jgi:hypothetical protein